MTSPGTVSSTSAGRASGRPSICLAVTAPSEAASAIPMRLSDGFSTSARFLNVRWPVTVTSAVSASVSTTSTTAGRLASRVIGFVTCVKLSREKRIRCRPGRLA